MARWPEPFGWSRAQWATFALGGLLVFVVVPAIAHFLGWGIGNAVLWVSGIILWVYTLETQAMRRETVAANKLAVQPLLITTVETPVQAAGAVIFVRNIGKGPALRIRFDDIRFVDGEASRFCTADCLEAGEKQRVRGQGDDWIAALDRRTARENYRITITYEDMNGEEHKSVMQMGADGTRLLQPGE